MRCEAVIRPVVIIPRIWAVWVTAYVCTKERYRPQRDSNLVPPGSESTTLPMSYPGAICQYIYILYIFCWHTRWFNIVSASETVNQHQIIISSVYCSVYDSSPILKIDTTMCQTNTWCIDYPLIIHDYCDYCARNADTALGSIFLVCGIALTLWLPGRGAYQDPDILV